MRDPELNEEPVLSWRPPAVRRWSEADARAALAALERSGERLVDFARRHGIDEQRLRRWPARLAQRSAAIAAAPSAQKEATTTRSLFLPVQLVAPPAVTPVPPMQMPSAIEIVVGSRVLRVARHFCPDTLRQIIAVLEEAAC